MEQLQQFNMFFQQNWAAFSLLTIWVIFWKGISLWIASKNNQRIWFLIILVLNTAGILEIIYIFFIAKKKLGDIKQIFSKTTLPKVE